MFLFQLTSSITQTIGSQLCACIEECLSSFFFCFCWEWTPMGGGLQEWIMYLYLRLTLETTCPTRSWWRFAVLIFLFVCIYYFWLNCCFGIFHHVCCTCPEKVNKQKSKQKYYVCYSSIGEHLQFILYNFHHHSDFNHSLHAALSNLPIRMSKKMWVCMRSHFPCEYILYFSRQSLSAQFI